MRTVEKNLPGLSLHTHTQAIYKLSASLPLKQIVGQGHTGLRTQTENCSTFQKSDAKRHFLTHEMLTQCCHIPISAHMKNAQKVGSMSFLRASLCHVWNMFIHLLTWPLPKENPKNANLVKNYISPLPFPPLHLTGSCKKYERCQNTFNLAN